MRNHILRILVNDEQVATIYRDQVPVEFTRVIPIRKSLTIIFEDIAGPIHRHRVPASEGWLHLTVFVQNNLACQASALATSKRERDPETRIDDGEIGVRFQPFFLDGASDVPDLTGQGLFARGLHFGGTITPSNIMLSCRCDVCRQAFLARSFHTGWGGETYFYSESGRFTLITPIRVGEAPVGMMEAEYSSMQALEEALPKAPDGSAFLYTNLFRCPHCAAIYIDFKAHPGLRNGEYYGLYLEGTSPIHFP